MMITLVALMCYVLDGTTHRVCHEEIVARAEMSIMQCAMGHQQVVSDWKEHSRFRGDQWTVAMVMCRDGSYQPKDMI